MATRNHAYDLNLEKARAVVRRIIEDPEYRRNLKRRALAGILPPAMETMLWHYLYGKPQDVVKVEVEDHRAEIIKMTDDELRLSAQEIAASVISAKEEYDKNVN